MDSQSRLDVPATASSPDPQEIAAAAGASDLFLFRRIADARFAHIGGVGRGQGWAGIVELGLADERAIADALRSGEVVRRFEDEPWHVFGPYYSKTAVIVPLDDDAFAVFGAADREPLSLSDDELRNLASYASAAMGDVAPAKRLADELEVANAVRDLLCSPGDSFDEAAHSVVARAAASLSCELGVLYVPGLGRLAIFDSSSLLPSDEDVIVTAMRSIADRGELPVCIQEASSLELPHPFSTADGTVSYYLLGIVEPTSAVLLLAHTAAAPRGFTRLCQSLGLRLVEAAGPLLATALARDGLRSDLVRASDEARRDALTGLANRLAWDEAIAVRAPGERPVSIVQLDCRGLKNANDTHGHHVGDRLLRRVAELARTAVRDGDLVARVGGDEFAILLEDADENIAEMVVGRLQAAIAAEPPIETIELAVAVGSATTRTGDLACAHQDADARMLSAKRAA